MNTRISPARCLPVLLACLAGLGGCTSPRIDLALASQPNVNPDNSGRPSPVIVKSFELRSELNFKQTDFQTLFDKPVQALGSDIIAADEMALVPGEARKVAYSPNPETRFLGVIAGFRQMERGQWRMIKPVNAEKKNLIALELNDTSILIIPDDQAKDWDPEESVKMFQQQLKQPAPPQTLQPQAVQATQTMEPAGRTTPEAGQSSGGGGGGQAAGKEQPGSWVTTVKDKAADNLTDQVIQRAGNQVDSALPTVSPPPPPAPMRGMTLIK